MEVKTLFENDVKTYGTQAEQEVVEKVMEFENDVKTYGTQAAVAVVSTGPRFENDVKTYGIQAIQKQNALPCSLRMM